MKQNRLERLDMAARAIVAEKSVPSMIFLVLPLVLLTLNTPVRSVEGLAARILLASCVVGALLRWLRWRYAFYVTAFVWAGVAICQFFFRSDLHTVLGLISHLCGAVGPLLIGWKELKRGIPFAIVHGDGWELERAQTGYPLETRINAQGNPFLFVPTGSFWTGYFTYAINALDEFWAVAKFKTGSDALLDYRILEKNAVRIVESADGTMVLHLNGKKKAIAATPELRRDLSRFGVPAAQ